MVVAAAALVLLDPAEAAFSAVPETADLQQRLRVAADTLSAALMMAGAGPASGRYAGGLHRLFAPVLPYRTGYRGNALPGSFTADTVTILFVPSHAVQTTTSIPVTAGNAALRVNAGADEITEAADVVGEGIRRRGGKPRVGNRHSRRIEAPREAAELLHLVPGQHSRQRRGIRRRGCIDRERDHLRQRDQRHREDRHGDEYFEQ